MSDLRQRVEALPWYHAIDLGGGVVTPGVDRFRPVWENIRLAREALDHGGKSVLDLASMEGMWAFEAERLGAERVVATDCYLQVDEGFGNPLERLLLCREALASDVLPYGNVSPYFLTDRLDLVLHELGAFDVVHHLGLLYHLRDPLLSLSQSRNVVRTGGQLLIETVVAVDEGKSYMVFNGVPPEEMRIYDGNTTWWAPTLDCLAEMLGASLFEPRLETVRTTPPYEQGAHTFQRAALVCDAADPASVPEPFLRELRRTYRNPGLERI